METVSVANVVKAFVVCVQQMDLFKRLGTRTDFFSPSGLGIELDVCLSPPGSFICLYISWSGGQKKYKVIMPALLLQDMFFVELSGILAHSSK